MAGFYVAVVACVVAGALPWPALAAFGAVPLLARALRAFAAPRPERPPRGFPIWPLWFVAFVFTHTRRAGALLVGGLAVAAIFGLGPALAARGLTPQPSGSGSGRHERHGAATARPRGGRCDPPARAGPPASAR